MGLPGAGKTFLATALKKFLETNSSIRHMPMSRTINMEMTPSAYSCTVDWFNADDVRKRYNDWDFSREGRIRQSIRMADFALSCTSDYVICDFVAPLVEQRKKIGS
jgi:adenylylsulfate kinase-like enzyme